MQLTQVTFIALSLALCTQAGVVKRTQTPPCIKEGSSKTDICKSFSEAGFLNLNAFGCSSGDFSPTVNLKREIQMTLEEREADIQRRELSLAQRESVLEKRWGHKCECPPPPPPEHEKHHHHKWTSPPPPPPPPHHHHHKGSPSPPPPPPPPPHHHHHHKWTSSSSAPSHVSTPPPPPPSGGGPGGPMICPGSGDTEKNYCESLSRAGLINLNLFGCSSDDFSPTISVSIPSAPTLPTLPSLSLPTNEA